MTSANPRLWSVQCVLDWLQIREKEGKPFPGDVAELTRELDHSGLLRRLMEGKHALPEPPPLSFAYPWYELVENGFAEPFEVFLAEIPGGTAGGGDSIFVNQHPWRIVKASYINESYIVKFGTSSTLYKLWVTGLAADESGASRKSWRIEKM